MIAKIPSPHRLFPCFRALSSVVERLVYTENVGGSKPSAPILFLTLLLLMSVSSFAQQAGTGPAPAEEKLPKKIYVIPVRDDIDAHMPYIVRRGVKEAIRWGADALVLHMDTNGGRVDYTEEITQAVREFPHPEQTYTFVDTKAFSAGAFIAASTRSITMAPSSVIGALTPIMTSSSGGGIAEMPQSAEEKITSAIRALVRASAEANGHNPAVFDAMVDRDNGLTIGDTEIVPKGKILTLTSEEALKEYGDPPTPLLSSGTYPNLDALTEKIGGGQAEVITLEPTGFENLARHLLAIAPFLLSAAFILGYIEFQTQGFGLWTSLAALCVILFFFSQYAAGLTGYETAAVFLLGLVLVLVELLFFPGIVLPALTGVFLMLLAATFAMADIYPDDPYIPPISKLQIPLTRLSYALVTAMAGILALFYLLPYTPFQSALVLGPTPDANSLPESENESARLPGIGQTGTSLTPLRPSGTADFGDGPCDVITHGDFIKAKESIRICAIEGNKRIVEKA